MASGLLLSDDFLFISRVQGHARAAGLDVKSVRTPETLFAKAAEAPPACVLLDVHVAGEKLAETVAALKAMPSPPTIVGYGSHIAAAALKAARDAGCDMVMPNSEFTQRLASDLPSWFGAAASD